MSDPLHTLATTDLQALAAALRSGRLSVRTSAAGMNRIIGRSATVELATRLKSLSDGGWSEIQATELIDAIVEARGSRRATEDLVELVWTGPEVEGTINRDTAVVVRELFSSAKESVLISGFSVHQGRDVFRGLAERMCALPALQVRLYLDVHLGGDRLTERNASDLVVRFSQKFVEHDWPLEARRPEVYYDPRPSTGEHDAWSCLHAKCVIVDRRVAFVTSANFSRAAQERNIEAGVVVRSPPFAGRLADHFGMLTEAGHLRRLVLP
ncbi:MAG TPA: DISARM system phospholipase D-like protein DrmC [Pirellulales bacterium]